MALTEKQRRFIDAYLIEPNGKKAAIKAGYSAATAEVQASRLLRHVEVGKAIAEGQKMLSIRSGITPDMVLAELAKIGFSDIRNAVRWRANVVAMEEDEETGEPVLRTSNEVVLVDSDRIDDGTAAAIAEVSQTKDGALKVKFHDKRAALVDIGKHLGMFRPAARGPNAGDAAGAVPPGAHDREDTWDGLLN